MSLETKSVSRWLFDHPEFIGLEDPVKCAYMTVRELVENSLDSCEDIETFPEIRIVIENGESNFHRVEIRDNGSGIPENDVPQALGVVLTSSKYRLRQQRGFLGIGGKGILQHAHISTQKALIILSATKGSKTYWVYKLGMDINRNRPVIYDKQIKPNPNGWHGVIIRFNTKADFQKARSTILQYIKLTHLVCPYSSIQLVMFGKEEIRLTKTVNVLPPRSKIIRFHPHGITVPMLEEIILGDKKSFRLSQLMQSNFQRIGPEIIKKFMKWSGLSDKSPRLMTKQDLVAICEKLSTYDGFYNPDTSGLSPITEDIFVRGIQGVYDPEWIRYNQRKCVHGGHGFIVEMVMAYGGKIPVTEDYKFSIFRFANRIPLLYESRSCIITKTVEDLKFKLYDVLPNYPIAFFVNISSTKIPFKVASKEYIADVPAINKGLSNGLLKLCKQFAVYIHGRTSHILDLQRRNLILSYIPLIVDRLAKITGSDPSQVSKRVYEGLGWKERDFKKPYH